MTKWKLLAIESGISTDFSKAVLLWIFSFLLIQKYYAVIVYASEHEWKFTTMYFFRTRQ